MSHLDRKNLLWEGSRMFLPEHRQALLQQRRETERFTPPELDEQQWETIAYLIEEAIAYEQPILATYATSYVEKTFCGFIDKVDLANKYIQLSNGSHTRKIAFHRLMEVAWP